MATTIRVIKRILGVQTMAHVNLEAKEYSQTFVYVPACLLLL